MTYFSLREAEQDLARLIALVQRGEKVVIEADGKPVAQLTPPPVEDVKRQSGRDQGRYTVPDDFDDPLPSEILEGFNL
jgi:antitoxin (DNA-binding transcriptional repressor) of toxin-antitoxin stability system